jgi:nucleotide-binding universal stress UspA family protein
VRLSTLIMIFVCVSVIAVPCARARDQVLDHTVSHLMAIDTIIITGTIERDARLPVSIKLLESCWSILYDYDLARDCLLYAMPGYCDCIQVLKGLSMKILAAIDNSAASDAVVGMLATRAWPRASIIRLVTVVEKAGLLGAFSSAAEDRASYIAHQHLADIVRDLSAKVSGVKIESEVIVGHVKEALIQAAEGWLADLIIVGSHGKQHMDIVGLGTVSQSLLHHSPCPVLIVKQSVAGTIAAKEEFNVLVPVDQSEYSEAALEWVLKQQWKKKVNVELLTVLPSMDQHYTSEADPDVASMMLAEYNKYKEENLNMLRGWAGKIQNRIAGSVVKCDVLEGDARETILAAEKRWPADLIIMGSHGRSGISRFLLGSISQGVSLHCQCSVEIVRHRELIEAGSEQPDIGFPREDREDQDRTPHAVW